MMKKRIIIVLCFVIIAAFFVMLQASPVHAHPPGYMKLTYAANTLDVTVLHFTIGPQFHRVYKIDVEVNGALVASELSDRQPRLLFVKYKFDVNAASGDLISVTASCSLFGQISRSVTVQ